MSKPPKKAGNSDFRHRVIVPAPTREEIESRLIALVMTRRTPHKK
nr:hypothetical protein [Nostoc sp. ChiSLP03a]